MQGSLLDAPQGEVIGEGFSWLTALLGGSLAVGLAVIGIALMGFLLLTGRVDMRRTGWVVLGAFILFGTPLMVAGLIQLGTVGDGAPPVPPVATMAEEPPRENLPPANHDPYAGASLRRD